MEKLPEDFKQKWIAALRSGEYKQGRNQLRNDSNEYCCLGVGCVVAGISPEKLKDFCYAGVLAMEYHDLLPPLFRDTTIDSPSWKLASMNDTGGKSFSEIADWIQENL